MPARPGKPRDKAKAETAVLVAQRWILACLRNRTFFSLDDLNAAMAGRNPGPQSGSVVGTRRVWMRARSTVAAIDSRSLRQKLDVETNRADHLHAVRDRRCKDSGRVDPGPSNGNVRHHLPAARTSMRTWPRRPNLYFGVTFITVPVPGPTLFSQ